MAGGPPALMKAPENSERLKESLSFRRVSGLARSAGRILIFEGDFD